MKTIVMMNPLVISRFSAHFWWGFQFFRGRFTDIKLPFYTKRAPGAPEIEPLSGLKLSVLDFTLLMQ